ncbi:MAG: DUF4142 domain-containing protein [Candidatus Omnitrophica bacterium]|nr:DUF4142 domain-containing protein [Candidatus Omnitrophota bacterium]
MKKYFLMVNVFLCLLFVTGKVWASDEAEALSLIAVIDRHEVKAAEDAISKNSGDGVVEYAQMLKKAHSQNLEKGEMIAQKLGLTLPDTQAVKDLRDKTQQDFKILEQTTGEQYPKLYITSMVKGHMDALVLIDQLKKKTGNRDVAKFLKQTYHHVATHLKKAKAIESDMEENNL